MSKPFIQTMTWYQSHRVWILGPLFVVLVFPLYLFLFWWLFFWWQHHTCGHNAHTGSVLKYVVVHGYFWKKKKKKICRQFVTASWCVGHWWLLGVIVGLVYGGRQSCSGHREKKKNLLFVFVLLKRWPMVIVWFCCCCSWSGRNVVFSG